MKKAVFAVLLVIVSLCFAVSCNSSSAPTLSGIVVSTYPTKMTYVVGESLDLSGMVVKGEYSDKSTSVITAYTTDPADGSKLENAGTQTVAVAYEDKKTSFDISVVQSTVSSIAIKTEPTKTTYYVGDYVDTTGLVLTVNYNSGKSEDITSGFTVSPALLTEEGKQNITVGYGDKTTSYQVTVSKMSVNSITIKTEPAKKTYAAGDLVDTTGLVLTVNYSSGKSEDITSGYSFSPATLNTAGTQTITVLFGGKTDSYQVTVSQLTVISISVKTEPDKKTYYTGDTVDTTGLVLTAKFNNGETADVTSGFSVSPAVLTEEGKQNITVGYGDKTTSYQVTVSKLSVSSITIKTEPHKKTYAVGDLVDTTGLVLTVNYSSGKSEDITSGYSVSPATLNAAGDQKITVSYGEKTALYQVSVSESIVSSISVKTEPDKKTYYTGDRTDTTGMVLTVHYDSGESKDVTSGYSVSPNMFTTAGTQDVSISFGGKIASYQVSVEQLALESISVKTEPAKKTYAVGDLVDTTGLVLAAEFNNGNSEAITSGYSVSPTVFNTAGPQKVTVSLWEKETSYQVTVAQLVLESISIKTEPTKKSYFTGDVPDTAGMVLTVHYNNGNSEDVTSGYSVSPTIFTTEGAQAVNISFGGKTTSYQVTVEQLALESIAIKTEPTKKSYKIGEPVDTTGLVLTAKFNNGESVDVTAGYFISPTVLSEEGEQEITVYYGDKSVKYTVIVYPASENPTEYITFSSSGSFSIKTGNGTKNWNGTLLYSTNAADAAPVWNDWDGKTVEAGLNSSDNEYKIYFAGKNNTKIAGSYEKRWVISGSVAGVDVSGNSMTLLDWKNPSTTLDNTDNESTSNRGCFKYLFAGCAGLSTVSDDFLPATDLAEGCYQSMFQDCTSLKAATEFYAITLAAHCYDSMFRGCKKITVVPIMAASPLAEGCYQSMFQDCTSLTDTPLLYATPLAKSCYQSMFQNCTSLKDTPVLPAMTLAESCYQSMFQGCTSLTEVPELNAIILAENCYQTMFQDCKSLKDTPVLSATTLTESCYQSMFQGCKSLSRAPVLSATILAKSCYQSMFQDCTSLTAAPMLPAKLLAENCYQSMFQGCTSLTAAPELSSTTLASYCYSSMFQDCSSLAAAPDLPATILAPHCYFSMFQGCTSLKKAMKQLDAATLTIGCYYHMFDGCTSLEIPPIISATELNHFSCAYMFNGCSSLTVFADDFVPPGYKLYPFFTCPSTQGLQLSVWKMFEDVAGPYSGEPFDGGEFCYLVEK